MATKSVAKKTTAKTTTVAKAAPVEKIEVVETTPVVEVEAKPVVTALPKKKEFAKDEGILCRSITDGWLGMEGLKSKILYQWHSYGDLTEVEYEDLVSAVRSSSPMVYAPYFVIENQDFLDMYPQVQKAYESRYTQDDLNEIFTLSPSNIKKAISGLPDSIAETVKSMAVNKIRTGELDSVSRIKALDEAFNIDLTSLITV